MRLVVATRNPLNPSNDVQVNYDTCKVNHKLHPNEYLPVMTGRRQLNFRGRGGSGGDEESRGTKRVSILLLFGLGLVVALRDNIPQFSAVMTSVENVSSNKSINTASNKHGDCCSLAKQDSFGLFDDITDIMWKRIRQHTQQASWYWNPKNPLAKVAEPGWWNAHNMIPNFACPHKEKLGGVGNEGTKYVCNPRRLVHEEKPSCLVYSVGCAGDFKFEDELFKLHNKSCEIHVFDPANWERKGDVENKNIHYHAWGFKSTYDLESKSVVWPKGRRGGFKTFPDTLKELGHEDRVIDIFKIDCEGCEWSSHKDWISVGFRQILIEMHGVPTPEGTPKARWYQKPMDLQKDYYQDFLDNGYALFNHDPNGELGLELSFIKFDKPFWEPSTEKVW